MNHAIHAQSSGANAVESSAPFRKAIPPRKSFGHHKTSRTRFPGRFERASAEIWIFWLKLDILNFQLSVVSCQLSVVSFQLLGEKIDVGVMLDSKLLVIGYSLLDIWILSDIRCWILDTGYQMLDCSGYSLLDIGN